MGIERQWEGTRKYFRFLNNMELQGRNIAGDGSYFPTSIPGVGKTAIASIVASHLRKEFRCDCGVGIAFLYSNFWR